MGERKTALVLSGGGARGAYEAGILHHLRKKIWPDRHGFHIHTGTSAGALNTAFITAFAHEPAKQGERLLAVWKNLRSPDIYKGDFKTLYHFITRSAAFIGSHLFGFGSLAKRITRKPAPFQGLLDTTPFIGYLKNIIPFKQIRQNIIGGPIDAVAIAATNIGTGKIELFLDKKPDHPYTSVYTAHEGPIYFTHAMASAAVPIIFPPVRIGPRFYVDGSMRQNTPMSPAIQLGADKLLIIGVKHRRSKRKQSEFNEPSAYPSFTHMTGQLMNSLFLDHIEYDLAQVERINRIIEWSEKLYGPDYLEKLNATIKRERAEGDIAARGLRKIRTFSFFPGMDIGKVATDRLLSLSRTAKKLTSVERFFLKFLEVDPKADLDLLSYLMFEEKYISDLIDIGIQDAASRETELLTFLEEQ